MVGFRTVRFTRFEERGITILLATLLIALSISATAFMAVMIQFSRLAEQRARTEQLLSIRAREQLKVFLRENGESQYIEVVNTGTFPSTVVAYVVKGRDGSLRCHQITGQAGGWPGQWKYRVPITISTGPASASENYILGVTMNTASLLATGKIRSDAGDVRFAMADGVTPLEYFLEKDIVTQTVYASADAYVDSGSPTTNYGGDSTLKTEYYDSYCREAYLAFPIPAGTIKSAKLRLYVTSSLGTNTYVYSTESFDEYTVTWDNRPLKYEQLAQFDHYKYGSSLGWVEVTSAAFLDYIKLNAGTTVYLALSPGYKVYYASRETANKPQLVLEYVIENSAIKENEIAWIKYPAPLSPNTNYTIYAYYGNPGARDRGNWDTRFYFMGDTLYFRSDGHTVNELDAGRLENTQDSGWAYLGYEYGYGWIQARWGIRVWRRTPAGVETEITPGTPVAIVERLESGRDYQEATWTFPGENFSENDSLVVRIYFQKRPYGGESWENWCEIATYSTPRLILTTLRASTWRVIYDTYLWNGEDQGGDPCYTVDLFVGSGYATRIENISFSTSSLITASVGSEEQLSPPPARAILVNPLEKRSFALEIIVGADEKLGVLTQLGNLFWCS